jgi:hypothetical protein
LLKYVLRRQSGPKNTTLPFANKSRCVNRSKVWEEGWWITHMIILPESASFLIVVQTPRVMYESSPDVGSSAKIIEGSLSNSVPKAKRFFSPPEMPE